MMGKTNWGRCPIQACFWLEWVVNRTQEITHVTASFAYDGYNLIETMNSTGSIVARYTFTQNIDEPLAMQRSGSTSYYQADALGSVTSLTSSTGSVANTYTYDSFGKVTNSTGSLRNPFFFAGREYDKETSRYFNRARYYSPSTGRFISEDPIRFLAGVNFYSYVGNEPTSFTDPGGLCKNKLSLDQCQAIRELLDREALFGTRNAASMSAIGYGDNTLWPFNSSTPGQAYVETALGTVKLDWFTNITIVPTSWGKDSAYFFGKLVWTGLRSLKRAPISNYFPYQDPVETHTAFLAVDGTPYRDLFPPGWMAQNCPGH